LDSQTRQKIEQEERFKAELLVLFNRIRSEYRVSVATGNPIRAARYEAQFKALLEAHYRRVQKAFRGKTGLEIQDEDVILAALSAWASATAGESVNYIVDTTQKNMDDALRDSRQSLSDSGITTATDRELAAVVIALLFRVFQNRASAIAVLETQRSAESTKLIEAYDAAGISPLDLVIGVGTNVKKKWVTVGDDKVRPAHRVANGQTKPINQPFIVAGEKLMFPGDTSLGASIKNVANCRCNARYLKK
jgi:hypothetical protein